ncbi:MAG: leukotriene A4 hydrolase C-terminal domain-containing protein, partial [Saprospiraceae bacterium]|nr:leukotriene A4 hydrolase C-terminal domain-containing protein [Saprospiraceae bacterium]
LEPYDIKVDLEAWIYGPGIPLDMPEVSSDRFEKVDELITRYADGAPFDTGVTNAWTTHEWLHFIRHLPEDMAVAKLRSLDDQFALAGSGNAEIAAAWYEVAIRRGYADEIKEEIVTFLTRVGRRKFLMPIYRAMKESGMAETARDIYQTARPNYHAVSTQSIDKLLEM